MSDAILSHLQFPVKGEPKWWVRHAYSTGSTSMGTSRHVWEAVLFRRALSAHVLTYSKAEAEAIAADMTERNVEP